jgi:hypothetical protein
MSAMLAITHMASDFATDDIPFLSSLLESKLKYIPDHVLPALTIEDILLQTTRAVHVSNIPADLQLPFLLRQRTYIDRHGGRPIKDDNEQSLDITRACFQRYHDTSRWNLALFTALLSNPRARQPTQTARAPHHSVSVPARNFMESYLSAVMERHNTPTIFTKREEFIKKWKGSRWDLYQNFKAAQKKLLRREVGLLTKKWEIELDVAIREMGRTQYD